MVSTALMMQLGGIVPRARTPSVSVTKNSHPASMAFHGFDRVDGHLDGLVRPHPALVARVLETHCREVVVHAMISMRQSG